MDKYEMYMRVKAKDDHDYICPLHIAQYNTNLRMEQLDDCVEAEVVDRYIGHLNIVAAE